MNIPKLVSLAVPNWGQKLDNEMHKRADDPPLKVTREISPEWLIGGIVALIVNAVTVWVGQQNLAATVRDMTTEMKELRATALAGSQQAIKHDMRLDDHERRIGKIEAGK